MNGQEKFQVELGQLQEYCQKTSFSLDEGGVSLEKVHEICSSLHSMVGRLFCIADELNNPLKGGITFSEKGDSEESKPPFNCIQSFRRKNAYYDLLIFEEAVKELKRVINESNDPHVIASAYNGLGHMYAIKKKYIQAIYFFDRVVEFYPGNNDGYFNLGAAWFNLGSFDEARYYFQQAIYHHSDDWEACFHLGRTYEKLGSVDSAIYYMQLAREKKYGISQKAVVSR